MRSPVAQTLMEFSAQSFIASELKQVLHSQEGIIRPFEHSRLRCRIPIWIRNTTLPMGESFFFFFLHM